MPEATNSLHLDKLQCNVAGGLPEVVSNIALLNLARQNKNLVVVPVTITFEKSLYSITIDTVLYFWWHSSSRKQISTVIVVKLDHHCHLIQQWSLNKLFDTLKHKEIRWSGVYRASPRWSGSIVRLCTGVTSFFLNSCRQFRANNFGLEDYRNAVA